MKPFLSNRRLAVVLTAVMVIAALWLGSAGKLKKEYASVTGAFETGADGSGISIASGLRDRVETARNLITVSRRYTGAEKEADELKKACDDLEKEDRIDKKAKLNSRLSEASYGLYLKMGDLELSESDEGYRSQLYARLLSAEDVIGRDGYNKLAKDYNKLAGGFPAFIWAFLGGVSHAPVFSE